MTRVYILVILLICVRGLSQEVKIEPPHWWAGMASTSLQLMLYAPGVASATVTMEHPGVIISNMHPGESPNYLFLDLMLSENLEAGVCPILLQWSNSQLTVEYEFKSRRAGSAERSSFGPKDVIYLVTPDRFVNGDTTNDEVSGMLEKLARAEAYGRHGGDIEGMIQSIPYMKDMGFTALWVNPLLENNQPKWSYHGYATTDYYKIDPRFGSLQEYKNLSSSLRKEGMGLIMDVIVNHCGHFHPWMKDPPFMDWINRWDEPYQETNHRKETLLDPYGSAYDREVMTEGWFVPNMPDLNQRNPFMATYLIQNSIWWIEEADLYGLRQDTYSYSFKEFMTAWTCAIRQEYPNFNIVGEEWTDDTPMISYWQEGKDNADKNASCLPSLMDFPLLLALPEALTSEESFAKGFIQIYQVLARDYHYPNPDLLVIFPDNHDISRIYTRLDEDYRAYQQALTLVLTIRGIPQIYYGTEILMSHPGTDSHGIIRSDFPGGWAGDSINAFEDKQLDSLVVDNRNWLKKFLHWRKNQQAIHEGKLMHFLPHDNIYSYVRYKEDKKVVVILNKNEESTEIDTKRYNEIITPGSSWKDAMSGIELTWSEKVILPPQAVFILEEKSE